MQHDTFMEQTAAENLTNKNTCAKYILWLQVILCSRHDLMFGVEFNGVQFAVFNTKK